MAFEAIHRPLFTESKKIEFPNNNSVSKNYKVANIHLDRKCPPAEYTVACEKLFIFCFVCWLTCHF